MKDKRIAILILFVYAFLGFSAFASAEEPTRPRVDRIFDPKKEAKIRQLENRSLKETFERLRDADFFANEDFLNKGIHKAFGFRKREAISFAIGYLRSSQRTGGPKERREQIRDLYVAKKILQVFPEEAVNDLQDLYRMGDPITRRNVLYAAGKMADGQAVKNMLIEALDDKSFSEESDPEMVGEPLRICDVAYNQLVLRYRIKNVLRAIGNTHRIELRDYHIDILKDLL